LLDFTFQWLSEEAGELQIDDVVSEQKVILVKLQLLMLILTSVKVCSLTIKMIIKIIKINN